MVLPFLTDNIYALKKVRLLMLKMWVRITGTPTDTVQYDTCIPSGLLNG
jgi:hypothetical protein